jgi:single stranded DNA-binding protein
MTGITAHLIGRLGRDAEHRMVKAGTLPMTTLAVAVIEHGKDATTWCRTVCFGKLAEATRAWLKGDTVTVEGRLELQRWTAGDGSERSGLSVVATSARLGSHRPAGPAPKPAKAKRQGRRGLVEKRAPVAPDADLNDDVPELAP